MERGRLGSSQRRKVRRSVRHAQDEEEENMRHETCRDGRLERVLTRFKRLEADMGLSAGRLTGQDVAAPGSTGGGVASW